MTLWLMVAFRCMEMYEWNKDLEGLFNKSLPKVHLLLSFQGSNTVFKPLYLGFIICIYAQ